VVGGRQQNVKKKNLNLQKKKEGGDKRKVGKQMEKKSRRTDPTPKHGTRQHPCRVPKNRNKKMTKGSRGNEHRYGMQRARPD